MRNLFVTLLAAPVLSLGIVAWAFSRKRKKAFDEAANAPFALPDDADAPVANAPVTRGGRPS